MSALTDSQSLVLFNLVIGVRNNGDQIVEEEHYVKDNLPDEQDPDHCDVELNGIFALLVAI